ncbi:TIGR02281 family clan AA aspartic protease [Paracoccus sp. S-4012]|uniref:retropepsin-like aspartic protease family protein n=1 Tax=Paracoccus sp. S-4012 TaxID=2665648 RepID=UPI0012AFC57F|nr:TIGR02281 family clan AA aspartic protease [Paracoccus sp. S-4012]MRX51059.1 TIGR02281 family clan AA aspartic protease [Paracoccus sp. S-4012]
MQDQIGRFLYLALLLAAIGGFLIVEFRGRGGQALRQALAWGLIFVGVIAAGGLWQDVRQSVAPEARVLEGGRIEVPLDPSGHAHLTAEVNGVPVRFVVDTGATMLALRQRDARRVGIDPDRLAYTSQARTANGIVGTAPVRLDSVSLGGVTDHDVPAMVIGGELDRSLMGMSFLSRFARVSFEGGMLVLER